jgi:hypothetical protein
MRAWTTLWSGISAFVLSGAFILWSPGAVAVLLTCCVVLTGLMVVIIDSTHVETLTGLYGGPDRRQAVVPAAVTALLLVGLLLESQLSPALSLLSAVLMTATSPWALGRVRVARRRARDAGRGPSRTTRAAPADAGSCSPPTVTASEVTATWVSGLTDSELCLCWRRSYVVLHEAMDPLQRAWVAAVRRHYLDEMERRDPDGLHRWLDAGARAAGDPGRYFGKRVDQ